MTRTSMARTVSLGLMAVAASSFLVACGSDDSTATGSPSTTTTTTAPAETTTSAAASSTTVSGTAAPTTSPGEAATAPPEQPQPVPSDFPGPTANPIDNRGEAFLAELKKGGITPAGNGEIAVSTANYICSAQSQGVAADEVSTFVTANVGVEASAAGTRLTAEQAGEQAQVYIAAAQATYCKP